MQIRDDVMAQVTGLLGDRCGWSLTQADYRRLQASLSVLQSRLQLDADIFINELLEKEALQSQLVDELVIPETYFFRYSQSYQVLKKMASQWLAENKTGIFRVASIPSATGEEPYSIAMMLHEAGIPLQRLSVDAMDVSRPLIEKSKQGIYSAKCLNRHPLVQQSHYFDEIPGGLQVKPAIRERVNFMEGNAKRLPPAFFTHDYPVIFCRNLLIYLTDDVRLALFKQIKSMLKTGGQLFVGPAEINFFLQQGMKLIDKSQVFLLQFASSALDCDKALKKPVNKTRPVLQKSEIALKAKPSSQPQRFKIENKSNKAALPQALVSTADESPQQDNARLLMDIQKLADSNDLTAANRLCEMLLKKEKSVSGYLLQGEILLAMGHLAESIQTMKKVLYMEPDNEEALAHLVLMCRRNGNVSEATRYQQCLEGVRG